MCDRDGVCNNNKCPCNEPEPCEGCVEKDALIADMQAAINEAYENADPSGLKHQYRP